MEKNIKEINQNNKNGVKRCPKCGAGEIIYNVEKEKLVCNYCNSEFSGDEIEGLEKKTENVKGNVRGTGTRDITEDNSIITLKCDSCGAEVIINTNETTNARCHWCRSILSINSQTANGAVPDSILPFKITKEEATKKIDTFISKHKSYANKQFIKEFISSNVMGVYLPYLLVDCNAKASFSGEGGHVVRSYSEISGRDSDGNIKRETYYDIDLYDVERNFDIAIDDLSIETSRDRLDKYDREQTNNIINSIMPFDTENCVKFEANYLIGFSSEKRDININKLESKINQSLIDITRLSINEDLKFYNSGIRWNHEDLDIKGKQIITAYLPVWLYSFRDKKGLLHYVAVNGRTGEIMGSVPTNNKKLMLIPISIVVLSILLVLFIFGLLFKDAKMLLFSLPVIFVILIMGIVGTSLFYTLTKSEYRNRAEKHHYEIETQNKITNIKRKDELKENLKRRSSRSIYGANNRKIFGEYTKPDE